MKKAYKKIIAVLLISQILSITSCSKDGAETDSTNESVIANTLYVLNLTSPDRTELADAIKQYNETSDVRFENKAVYGDNYEEAQKKFVLEIMSGQSADVILIENRTLPSPIKAANEGVFLNLDTLISVDKSFDNNLYNKKVLDSGVINKKRYFMPLGYNIFSFAAQNKVIESSGINLGKDIMSWDQMGLLALDFMNPEKASQQFFFYSVSEYLFDEIILNRKVSYIDYSKNKTHFNSEEFINTLDMFKTKIYPAVVSEDAITKTGGNVIFNCAMWDNGLLNGMNLRSGNKSSKNYLMPTYNGEQTVFLEPTCQAAISAKCKNKKAAYDFIKYLSTDKFQQDMPYFPINKKYLIDNTNIIFENLGSDQNVKRNFDVLIPKDVLDKNFDTIEELGISQMIDYWLLDIINSELKAYLDGSKTAEQTARTIDEKVQLYLNE